MAKLKFGDIEETVITREEFPLGKAREILKDETIMAYKARGKVSILGTMVST